MHRRERRDAALSPAFGAGLREEHRAARDRDLSGIYRPGRPVREGGSNLTIPTLGYLPFQSNFVFPHNFHNTSAKLSQPVFDQFARVLSLLDIFNYYLSFSTIIVKFQKNHRMQRNKSRVEPKYCN